MKDADSLVGLARRALALNDPFDDSAKEGARLRAQVEVLRALARRISDRVGWPGPAKGGA